MLSILIPTYHFNIFSLVEELHGQIQKSGVTFEILVYDDASDSSHDTINETITKFKHVRFKKLKTNIGRSAIRNMLAQDARYESLLFVDAGTIPANPDFINNYIKLLDKLVVTGGMTYLKETGLKSNRLRWLYTKKRELNFFENEQIRCLFHSSNFLIQKWVIKKFPFDTSLKGYGYEDVLFYEHLVQHNIDVHFINNPVIHLADDNASAFISKSEQSLSNLQKLIKNNELNGGHSKIARAFLKLKAIGLHHLVGWGFKALKPLLLINLNSNRPSLRLFDMYRLGYFCSINRNN